MDGKQGEEPTETSSDNKVVRFVFSCPELAICSLAGMVSAIIAMVALELGLFLSTRG